jgi:hypothetical protein
MSSDPSSPNPRRKARAGIIVFAIVLIVAVVIFVGLNLQHASDLAESPPAPPAPTSAPAIAPELAPGDTPDNGG